MQHSPEAGSILEGRGQGFRPGVGPGWGLPSRKPRSDVGTNTMWAMPLAGGPGFKAMEQDKGQHPRQGQALSTAVQEEDVRQESGIGASPWQHPVPARASGPLMGSCWVWILRRSIFILGVWGLTPRCPSLFLASSSVCGAG